ncbi:hypothetical protein Cantr_06149 [Candida viswanathii]|uniref:Uncharacterized protein n=1 Tax=Candida viswanathii TaxID=5486 RepID=A0A367XW90_9ASCO|nr:hypothetical protein Cantr_06149 [Candida viswanathii]
MWPFTSTQDTNAKEDITRELPPDLQRVFERESATSLSGTKFIPERYHRMVEAKLASLPEQHPTVESQLAFEKYKVEYPVKTVRQINCAEIENYVLQCNQHPWYKFWALPNIKASKDLRKCETLTVDGLKFLNYDRCYNIKHCEFIRYHLDKIYTKNFGELGERVNDETSNAYYRDLHELFYKVWE